MQRISWIYLASSVKKQTSWKMKPMNEFDKALAELRKSLYKAQEETMKNLMIYEQELQEELEIPQGFYIYNTLNIKYKYIIIKTEDICMKFKREEDRGATQEFVQTGSIADDKEELERNGTVTEGETVYIDMDKLRPNSNNMYSMSQIEKLGDLIKLSRGILQNIIVLPADEEGVYTITTGERRWRAARLLRDKGLYPEKFEGKVPCTIRGTG